MRAHLGTFRTFRLDTTPPKPGTWRFPACTPTKKKDRQPSFGFFLCEQEQTGFELGFSQRNPGNDSQGRGDDAVRGSGRSDLQRIPGPAQDALPDEQLLGLIKNRTATENWSFSSNWQSLPTSERQPGDSGSENFEDPLQ
jgi:hypothetical protein